MHRARTSPSWRRTAVAAIIATVGLAAAAAAQSRTWTAAPGVAYQRGGAQVVYDPARERAVSFGGSGGRVGGFLNETWEWDGSSWRQATSPGARPGVRSGHAVTYVDSQRHVLVFGGQSDNRPYNCRTWNDTWSYDSGGWRKHTTATAPSARYGTAMAYDSNRDQVVLFGGLSCFYQVFDDTWLWDGSSWTRASPTTAPRGQVNHVMAYDRNRDRVVMLTGTLQRETWEWNGSTWLATNPTTSPAGTVSLYYDEARMRVLAAGSSLWEWDGLDWTAVGTAPASSNGYMFYDRARQSAVWCDQNWATYSWDGTGWTQLAAPYRSDVRPAIAYDSARQRVVLFTGGRTYQWDGTGMPELATATRPGGRRTPMVYDRARGHCMLFSGEFLDGSALTADTWTWDGQAWTQLAPAASPPPRDYHPLAYDDARQRAVLFGGTTGIPLLGDTWEWDGQTWTQMNPANSPAASWTARTAYDRVRQRVVLVDGSETWEWDGVDWSLRSNQPPGVSEHAVAFDDAIGRVVMFDPYGSFVTLWSWDGQTWQGETAPRPGLLWGDAGMVSDTARQTMVLAGGIETGLYGGYSNQALWLLHGRALASVTATGTACGGTGQAPALGADAPFLGNPGFRLEMRVDPSLQAGAFALATAAAPQPVGTCTWFPAGAVVLLPELANGLGVMRNTIPLPLTPAFFGAQLQCQGLALDPLGPALGVSLSRLLTLQLGY